jgi:hemerythrin superfamily protein
MTTTDQHSAIGVIATVQRDHRQIEQMLANVERATGRGRQDAFEDLVRKLAVHETAEELVVHPLTKEVGAETIAESVLAEEDQAKKELSQLDGIDVTSAEFAPKFEKIKSAVLAHAQHEEREEHPCIIQQVPRDKLERLASVFETAEKTAPTRPHASAPESRAGNLVLGPIFAVTDRVRDAIRDAMKH